MASVICSKCGEFTKYDPTEIRGHDYPCPYNKDGIVVVIAKGDIFAGFKSIKE